tara:strand:- start:25 stop:141 length:117 start_codon:yes stop_codon:yes gene_type:complete
MKADGTAFKGMAKKMVFLKFNYCFVGEFRMAMPYCPNA